MSALQVSIGIDCYYNGQKLDASYTEDSITWTLPDSQGDKPAPVDPEAGLTPSTSIAPGSSSIRSVKGTTVPGDGQINRDSSAVVAMDFTGLDGSGGGLVFELGGAGIGSYVGFATDGSFHVRCGAGGEELPSEKAAYLSVPAADAPAGDGTLVVELVAGENAVRAWWNGVELGKPVARTSGSGAIAGGDVGAYVAKAVSVCAGEVNTPVPYESASDLRYYFDQTVAL